VLNRKKTHLSEQDKSVVARLLKKDKEFICCANCGSIDLTFPPINVDALVGAGSLPRRYYCRECEYEGLPLLFDELSAYEKFYSLRREKYNIGEDLLVADGLLSGKFGTAPVKKPYVAALLSLLIPGLGQAYNGEKAKAQSIFIVFLALAVVIPGLGLLAFIPRLGFLKAASAISTFSPAGAVLLAIYAFFDAYIVAKNKK
jgi:hypothetical protein